MSIFNQQAASSWTPNIRNFDGAQAYAVDPRFEIASILLTSFVKDKFYRSKESEISRLAELMTKVDPLFAAKAAVYARNEFGMRSISHVVAGRIGVTVKGADWTDRFFAAVARRPDDMLEILAYYGSLVGLVNGKVRKIPNAMKRGFAHRLQKFDAYQLGKYRSQSKQITLIDLVNLVRPKSTAAIGKLMKGELKSEGTFEGNISQAGRDAAEVGTEEEKAEIVSDAWGELIKTRKLGYMALLKNLRNIADQAPILIGDVVEMLQNREAIKKSLVLPFRYYTAYEELQKWNGAPIRVLLPALSNACDIALDNVPKLSGRTLIALDKSGSMQGQIRIASQLAAVLYKANNADLALFDTSARWLMMSPLDSTLSAQQTILLNCRDMGGTDFSSVFRLALERGQTYDRVVFISDEQHWVGHTAGESYRQYCAVTKTRPSIFLIDTAGYGSLAFPQDKVYAVAGFSEKIFDLMAALEEDRSALVNKIEAVTF